MWTSPMASGFVPVVALTLSALAVRTSANAQLGPDAGELVFRDDFSSRLWTFHPPGGCIPTDTIYEMAYSTAEAHSPTASFRQFAANGGASGRDCVGLVAFRDFPVSGPSKVRLRIKYLVKQFSGAHGGFGRMSTWTEIAAEPLDGFGISMGIFRYRVACSTVGSPIPCREAGTVKYIYGAMTPDGEGEFAPVAEDFNWPWLTLNESPTTDLHIDWSRVRTIRIFLIFHAGYMFGDAAEIFWDDLELAVAQ
jgi:hypothetical protein